MSWKRLRFSFFRRGRLSLPTLTGLFRSAVQLPFLISRYIALQAPAPAPLPRRNSFPLRFTLFLLVPLVLLVTFLALHRPHSEPVATAAPQSSLPTNWQSAVDLTASPESRRTIFPYSVIPGGVRDARELTNAVAKDPVVALHYSDFRVVNAHTLRLDRPAAMYVSYRRDNRVYWTRNKILIPAGETLISDGENLARVRCGNRLSAIAAKPVSASEPTNEQLETPEFVPPLLADLGPGEGAETLPGTPVALPALPLLSPGDGGFPGGTTPPLGSLPPILPPGVILPSSSSGPPPVATPEPSTLVLLLAGAMLCLSICALLRKQ